MALIGTPEKKLESPSKMNIKMFGIRDKKAKLNRAMIASPEEIDKKGWLVVSIRVPNKRHLDRR